MGGASPYSFQSVEIVRTQWGQMLTIFLTLDWVSVSRFCSASCWKTKSFPRRRAGSPVHFSFFENAVGGAQVVHDAGEIG